MDGHFQIVHLKPAAFAGLLFNSKSPSLLQFFLHIQSRLASSCMVDLDTIRFQNDSAWRTLTNIKIKKPEILKMLTTKKSKINKNPKQIWILLCKLLPPDLLQGYPDCTVTFFASFSIQVLLKQELIYTFSSYSTIVDIGNSRKPMD